MGRGDRIIRGAGVWAAMIALILVAVGLYPQQGTFAASGVDLSVRSTTLTDAEIAPWCAAFWRRSTSPSRLRTRVRPTMPSPPSPLRRCHEISISSAAEALVLEDAGGAQSRLISLDLDRADGRALPDNTGYAVVAGSSIFGSIGHWGHTHNRLNRYQVDLVIKPIDGRWKLAGFTLIDVVRNDPLAAAPAP